MEKEMEAINIFNNFLLLEQKSEEESLVYLYESLIDCDIKNCEIFLDGVIVDKLSSDAIVHILNVLSTRKNKIRNWENFIIRSRKRLIEVVGEKFTKTLLKIFNEDKNN